MTNSRISDASEKMLADAVQIATSRHDGANHDVAVILSDWSDYLFGHRIRRRRWLSAIIDNERILGGKLGVGHQTVMCKCTVFSPCETQSE